MRKIKTAALAVLLASWGMARADVLEKLPADALVVGRVANLTATSNKIAKLAKDLGIDAFVAPLQNPLAAVKADAQIEKGLNETGDVGFAFMDPKSADGNPDNSFVVLMPVSNYAEFLTNFGNAKSEGGVSEVTPRGGNRPFFAADWDGYAALSPTKALVAKPSATMKPNDAATKEAARQDFLVIANFKELGPKLMPLLDQGTAELTKELDQLRPDQLNAKYKPLIQVAAGQAFAAAKTFLNGNDVSTIGLNISDAGINTTVLSNFRADSYLGGLASGIKGTDKPLTVGLPALKYLAFGGTVVDAGVTSRVFDDFSKPIIAELQKIEGLGDVKKLVALSTAAVKKNTGSTFGMPALTKPGQEGILQGINIYRGGGTEMKQLFTEGSAFAKTFIADLKLAPEMGKPIFEQRTNDKSIEGVTFDAIRFEMKPDPNSPGAAMQEQMQAIVSGPNGPVYHYGVLGNDFIMANGTGDETIAAVIRSIKANEDNLSKLEQVKVVTAELPKGRVLEYYIALDEIVNTGVSTAAQFGLPIQVQLPPDLPPFGATAGADGTSLRFDTHLPTVTVQSLIAAGMQAFMAMRGGGGNL